MPWERQI